MHLLFSYFGIPVSKIQHLHSLVGVHGAHRRALELVTEVKSRPPAVIHHRVIIVLQTTVRAAMILLVNRFQRYWVIITIYHFGTLKMVVGLIYSMPISSNA